MISEKKNAVIKVNHCDDWFETSQWFVLIIAMNGLKHRCVFYLTSEEPDSEASGCDVYSHCCWKKTFL